jgi:AP-4 complex subunit sigma-1
MSFREFKVIYRRYASLYFIVGVDDEDANELAILEFIHALVESLDRLFQNVCELDLMFHLDLAHHVLDEMVANGNIIETNKTNILKPIQLMDKA